MKFGIVVCHPPASRHMLLGRPDPGRGFRLRAIQTVAVSLHEPAGNRPVSGLVSTFPDGGYPHSSELFLKRVGVAAADDGQEHSVRPDHHIPDV